MNKITKNPFTTIKAFEGNLFVINDNQVRLLDGISPFIWESFDEETNFQDLLDKILAEYSVTEKKASKDLKKFLEELNKIGAIQID